MNDGHRRGVAAAIVAAEVAAAALLAVAMALYPGGTTVDHSAPGHHFWRNFLCDLTGAVAVDGRPNPGVWPARAALLLLAGALTLFLGTAGVAAPAPGVRAWLARAAGGVSFLAMAGAFLLPQGLSTLHSVVVIAAALCGVLGAGLTSAAQARTARGLAALGILSIAGSLATTVLYARYLDLGGPAPLALTAGQKLTLFTILLWMAATCVRALARPPRAAGAGPRSRRGCIFFSCPGSTPSS